MSTATSGSVRTASTKDAFHHFLEFSNEASELVSRTALSRDDFRLAIYAAQFERFRHDPAAKYAADVQAAAIAPTFIVPDQPLCCGFSVTVDHPHGDATSLEFDQSYFAHRAKDAVSQLVRDGRVTQGAKLVYTLAAYDATDDGPSPADGIVLSAPAPQLTIHARPRATWGAAEPWDEPDPELLPVLVTRGVIDDAVTEAAASPDREIGGLLLGQLLRDTSGRLYVAVTGIAPGSDTLVSEAAMVTFTPATFARARQLLAMRADEHPGEQIVGQYHSHPMRMCEQCPLPTPTECIDKILFNSDQDDELMASCFAQPYMLGLVVGVEPRLAAALKHAPVRLFGWQRGTIRKRGFDVVEG